MISKQMAPHVIGMRCIFRVPDAGEGSTFFQPIVHPSLVNISATTNNNKNEERKKENEQMCE